MNTLSELLRFEINEANFPIRSEQVRSRVKIYPAIIVPQLVLAPLLVWLMWGGVAHGVLGIWLTLVYVVHATELYVWFRYRSLACDLWQCRRWNLYFKWATLAVGLIWGSAGALMFIPGDFAYQALLVCVVLGMAAGSVTSNPDYPTVLLIYLAAVLPPLLLRLLWEGDQPHRILALMVMVFVVFILRSARGLISTFELSLRQRLENEKLVQQLLEQKDKAEESRQKAELASREKSRFLAAASHDLRQPLQALTLFSEALKDAAKDNDTRHLAGQIEKSVHALADMFNELLDLSRLDAGIMAPHKQYFALQPLLDRLYVNFAPLAQAKKLGFEIPAGDGLPDAETDGVTVLHSDPFMLERILRNLLSNAIRYTDAGKIALRCQRSGDALKFEVVDTGIGIRAEIMPHIFEEYYQADNPHRDRRKGLGLGLAIVRRIEQLLDYRIEVVSEPGKGSTFSFTAALGDAEKLAHPFAITHSRHDLSGTTVALVEDDPDIRHLIAGLMGQWGCRVFAGESPDEVMRGMDVGAVRPDLLVCDYRLPHGLTAIHAIGQMRELWGHDIPAMVLTGDTAPEVLNEIQDSGAMLLHKPITPARLRSLMHLALHGEG